MRRIVIVSYFVDIISSFVIVTLPSCLCCEAMGRWTDGRTYARMDGIVGPGGIICEMKFFLTLCQWRWRRDVVFDGIVWGPLEFNEWMFCAIHPSVRPPAIRLVWPLELEGSGKTELTSASTIATDGVKRLRVSLRLDECWLSKVSRFICIPHHVHIKFKE